MESGCLRGNAVSVSGMVVTLDVMYDLVVDGEPLGRMYGSPQGFEDVVLGILVDAGKPRRIRSILVVPVEPGLLKVEASTDSDLDLKPVGDAEVDWSVLVDAAKKGLLVVPKKQCPLAAHVGVSFTVRDGAVELLGYSIDVSRHTLAYKLAGLLARVRASRSLPTAIAFLTARLSGDIVSILARAGYRIVIAPHHLLVSGVSEASKHGVTLVGKVGSGAELAPVTEPQRVKGFKGRLEHTEVHQWHKVASTTC